MLAHIAGVPVQESLLYLVPVIVLVAWMYFAGWRERRTAGGSPAEEEHPAATTDDGRPDTDQAEPDLVAQLPAAQRQTPPD